MPIVLLVRRLVRRAHAKQYRANVAELSEQGDCNVLAVCDCEATTVKTMPSGRPNFIGTGLEVGKAAAGRNKRLFVAVQDKETNQVIFLLLHPQEIETDDFDTLFQNASVDTTFSTDKGAAFLVATETVVTRTDADTFAFEPADNGKIIHETFEIKIVVDPEHATSQANATVTNQWLCSIAV